MKTALLLSGGMDSIALAYWKRPEIAITIDYGQRPAAAEHAAAAEVARTLGIMHQTVRADCRALGSGDLAGLPSHELAPVSEWWPFRNQLLVTLAAMQGMKAGVDRLLIGCVRGDGIHADGTQQFIDLMCAVLRCQEGAVSLEAPAITMLSAELIRAAEVPAELLAWAHSCHVADVACGQCRGCLKHYATMQKLGRVPY